MITNGRYHPSCKINGNGREHGEQTMSNVIVAENVEVWVSRDFGTYTHKIYRNGVLVSVRFIDGARAKQIVEEMPEGKVRGLNQVDWTPGAKQFTWIAQVKEG